MRHKPRGFDLDDKVKLWIPFRKYGGEYSGNKLPDMSFYGKDVTVYGAYRSARGWTFDGTDDYILDTDGRKVLREGTTGEWEDLILTDGEVPVWGSVRGRGTKLYFCNNQAPKITGKIVLYPEYCPSLTHLYCYENSISVLDVSALTNLTYLSCSTNSISTLDVSALTNLTTLYCSNNSISVLDVSALTSLTYLSCGNNSISTLDVSALTNLTTLYCGNNSMNSAMVDTVLTDLDNGGAINGTVNISDNAVPGAAGLTAKTNLEGKGWTVMVDS